MQGGVQFNEWLAREGYLTFVEPVTKPTAIKDAPIDWARTAAWPGAQRARARGWGRWRLHRHRRSRGA